MESFVRTLSPRREFAIVVLVAFGYFILSSVIAITVPHAGALMSDVRLWGLLVYESVVLAALAAFLSVRDWDLEQLGFHPSLRDTGIGVGLVVVSYAAYIAVWTIGGAAVPGLTGPAAKLVEGDLSVMTVLAVSVLNPVFEEVFVSGYVISALKKTRTVNFAVNASIAIRLAYHLYQGALGVIGIVPLGLVFAYWYARTGRLWPLVVAHAIFDFVGLMPYVQW